jgi:hypothetical protein
MSTHLQDVQCKLIRCIITKSVMPHSLGRTLGDTGCATQTPTALLNMVNVHCHFELQMTVGSIASH